MSGWRNLRIQHLAREVTDSIDPRDMGDTLVQHYSIPALDEFSGPDVQPASEIQSAKQPIRGGEVLISRLNPRKARVHGVTAIGQIPALCSTEFIVLKPAPFVEPRFLEYLLLSETMRQLLDASVQSVTRSHQRIRPEQLLKLQVPIPDRPEQRAIADYLDAETTRIDALVAKKQQMRSVLLERELALVERWFAPRPGEQLVRLGRLADVRSGVTVNAQREVGPLDLTLPYLRVANVQPGRLDLSEIKTVTVERELARRCRLADGDVLMTEGGDIDKLGRGTVWRDELPNCLHQNHVFAVRPRRAALFSDYLALLTRTAYARSYFESTGVQSTNLASTSSSKVADLRLPVLSLDEQTQRVASCDAASSIINQALDHLATQLRLLAEHRQALITSAVTGQHRVPGVA
jgi:type I restriction enzyme, S subunit